MSAKPRDADRLSRTGHHPVRCRSDLHADHGRARGDVIKVELAPFGDRGRASGDKPRQGKLKTCSQSTYYFQHNHSKRSLAVDIKQARGRHLIRAMVPKIDVVVENFAPA